MSRWPSSAMHSVSSKQAIRMERGEIRASLSIAPGLRVASPGRRGPLVRGRRRNGVPPARERRWSERREPAASASPSRHSREGGSPLWPFSHCGPRGFAPRPLWIPAFAGMTTRQVTPMERGEIRGNVSFAPGLRCASPGLRGSFVRGRRRNGVPRRRGWRWSAGRGRCHTLVIVRLDRTIQ